MQELLLTKGFRAIVDDDVFDVVSRWKWTAVVTGRHVRRVYAYRRADWDNVARRYKRTIFLHRFIMDAPGGVDVDHINGDTLDNQLGNPRFATRSQNIANSRRARGATGYRGVTVDHRDGSIKAQCCGHLGTFTTVEDAARAYDLAARQRFGPFATVNFP